MPLTPEQQAIVNHDIRYHGRVLAGPGTGKSQTSVGLLARITQEHPDLTVRMLTFTRAATAELTVKLLKNKIDVPPPSTLSAFALSLLVRHSDDARLPAPLRIPDSWEEDELIRKHLASLLKRQGFDVNVRKVEDLEREMSSRWEALDPTLETIADLDPELRNAYVGLWGEHRVIFGYTLLAELPFRAATLLEDFQPNIPDLDFLIIDEYQDLNRADISLLRLLAKRGIRTLAVGDDDQSIYAFRMAAPEGIIKFPEEFGTNRLYNLTISHRCGTAILRAANTLIEASPGRQRKPRLRPSENCTDGLYLYARFRSDEEEAKGVAAMIAARHASGVPLSELVVLVRSNAKQWADRLRSYLADSIPLVNTDWVKNAMRDPYLRQNLAVLALVANPNDSLAWWNLLRLYPGISEGFEEYLFAYARQERLSFSKALLHLNPGFPGAPTERSRSAASRMVAEVLPLIAQLTDELQRYELGETGWGGWILDRFGRERFSAEAIRLLEEVGRSLSPLESIQQFITHLEPMGKDIAIKSDSVRVMTMTSSKGLTVNSAFVMGVEAGLIPFPKARNDEDERRLLYVALTRATQLCVCSFAGFRRGPIARHGQRGAGDERRALAARGRSPLLEGLDIGRWIDGEEAVRKVKGLPGPGK